METQIQIFVVIFLLIIGISHAVRPRAWVEFFTFLRSKGEAGIFLAALLNLVLGLLIVAGHARWTGIAMGITLLGWAWTVKGTLYFIFPRLGLWSMAHVTIERARHFVLAGWVMIALSALFAYPLAR